MLQLPMIKLEIQEMKHAIMHHFTAYQSKLNDAVQEQLEKVIESYDYETAIVKAATECIDGAIESFFKYGEGRKIIAETLNEALIKTFKKQSNTQCTRPSGTGPSGG